MLSGKMYFECSNIVIDLKTNKTVILLALNPDKIKEYIKSQFDIAVKIEPIPNETNTYSVTL